MLFRQMNYFIKVVEHNSFTEAADACFISQSAISQQIQALEADLGVQLLVRENRKFTLTPAGEYFYTQSLMLLDDVERVKKETRRIPGQVEKTIRIGYLKNFGLLELQQSIASFSEQYPEFSFKSMSGNHETLYDWLRYEDVDMVVNDQRRALSDAYVNFHLCTVFSYVEISSNSPISKLESVTMDSLKKVPCVLIASQDQQDNEQAYYQHTLGFYGNFIFADNLENARMLVAANKGFMPIEGLDNAIQSGIAIRRVPLVRNAAQIQRKYFAFWKKEKDTEVLREFANVLKSKFLTMS